MATLTLPIRAYQASQLKLVDRFLKATLRNLRVETKINGITPGKWVTATISGADEKAASHYIVSKIGECPAKMETIETFSTWKGYLTSTRKNRTELGVDIGILSLEPIEAKISLHPQQAQLSDGRKVAPEKIAELFGLCENLPINIKVTSIEREEKQIEAMFSEEQISQFESWTRSLLDRLIVIGTSTHELTLAMNRARITRDVVNIESLGLFEHAVVCKLGTDAKGLIPKIGRHLPTATLSIFSPERIAEFLGYSFLYD